MTSSQVNKIGFWTGMILVVLGLAYLALVIAMILSGSGFPPVEPMQTLFDALILFTAVWMVFFWSILHHVVPSERSLFSRVSLNLIVIFATLTSINRYVGLTVVKQSLASGNTNGLQWFLPYSWPSIMMAIEFLAWGVFFGLACLCLAPVFRSGKLERSIFWILIATGTLSLLAPLGQSMGSSALEISPFISAATIAWGPGFTTVAVLISVWFRKASTTSK